MAGGWALVIALLGVSVIALALLGVWFASVVLAGIDLKHHRLPTPIIGTLAAWWIIVVVVPAVVGGQWDVVSAAAIGAVGLGGFYGLMWFIKPGAMGFGDVRLAASLGMILGSLGWSALAVGAIMGPLVGGIMGLAAILRVRKARGVRVPYGPALLAGAWAGILVGDVVGPWYLGLFGAV